MSQRHVQLSVHRDLNDTTSLVSIRSSRSSKKSKTFLLSLDDHLLTHNQLARRYHTDVYSGLTNEQVEGLLLKHGPNCLKSVKPKSRWRIFCVYLFGGFSALLWIGAILTFTGFAIVYVKHGALDLDQLYIGVTLVAVVLVTAIFGFHQEVSNVEIMEQFRRMLPKNVKVIRESQCVEISSERLVIGDLVSIRYGDSIPADLVVIEANDLKVDNSSITGESEPLIRGEKNTHQNPLETENLVFFGTHAVNGTGLGLVIATGPRTLMGRIAKLTTDVEPEATVMKKELQHFIHAITGIALALGLLCMSIALFRGYHFVDAFIFFIAIVVANVPEGLIVTMTASLTLTAKRMAKKNCLVKNLQAIETLGSTTVICSDKTGTLTQNVMTVAHVWYNKTIVGVRGSFMSQETSPTFIKLCRVGVLCSNAIISPDMSIKGDPSEQAILVCMQRLLGKKVVNEQRLQYPKICEIPFNSTRKFQASIHRMAGGSYILVMKGAPEVVATRCSTICLGNYTASIESSRSQIEQAVLNLGRKGERVLAFAELELPEHSFPPNYKFDVVDLNFPIDGLRFVGCMSMVDPPKAHVVEAIARCKSAGIKILMVTGDHPATAVAVAQEVGIVSPGVVASCDEAIKGMWREAPGTIATVVTGSEITEMSGRDLQKIAEKYQEIVFSRTTPQQKLQIVEVLQKIGEIVAVTGDGVNDSPALKKADIGIAMGISGSDVSKDAADMIILDDNFSTIVNGIEEGRIIFDNLKKSIAFLLTTNLPGLLPFILLIVLNLPPAISVMAILIIDIATDLWPGVSFAYEPGEPDIMLRTPRNIHKDKLVNTRLILFTYLQLGLMQACAGYTAYFCTMARHGFFFDNLLGLNDLWKSKECNDFKDAFGQEWTYDERKIVERKGYAAFYLGMAITQVADCIICKNRRLSIVHQKMNNHVMNSGLVFLIVFSLLLVYCPYVNEVVRFAPVEAVCVASAVPYALLIVILDEARRFYIRKYPGGWLEKETYF